MARGAVVRVVRGEGAEIHDDAVRSDDGGLQVEDLVVAGRPGADDDLAIPRDAVRTEPGVRAAQPEAGVGDRGAGGEVRLEHALPAPPRAGGRAAAQRHERLAIRGEPAEPPDLAGALAGREDGPEPGDRGPGGEDRARQSQQGPPSRESSAGHVAAPTRSGGRAPRPGARHRSGLIGGSRRPGCDAISIGDHRPGGR